MNEQNTNLGQTPIGPTPTPLNNGETNNQNQTTPSSPEANTQVQSQTPQVSGMQNEGSIANNNVNNSPNVVTTPSPVNSTSENNSEQQETLEENTPNVAPQNIAPQNQATPNQIEQPNIQTPPPVNNTPGTFGPSRPIDPNNNVSNVGFVATTETVKKKMNKKVLIAIVIAVIIALAAVGYFVVYPYVVKTFLNKPINVYNTTIENAFKELNNSINDIVHDKATYTIEAEFESNMDQLKEFSGYKVGFNLGIDPKVKNLQLGYSIKDPTTNIEYSKNTYLKDNKEYLRYSTYRDLIYIGEADLDKESELFASFEELFNKAELLDSKDLTYLTNKLSGLLKESIDQNKLSKEDASITVNGEKLKVTNNRYEIDYENYIRTEKFIVDGLVEDDKIIEILAKFQEVTKEEVKKELEEESELLEDYQNDDNDDLDGILYFNIYTYGLNNTIIGYSITSNQNDSELHYYNKDGNFELVADIHFDNENSSDDLVNIELDDVNISLIGKKDGKNTNVTLKINDNELLNLVVKEWNKNKIDLDYNLKYGNDEIKGTLVYSNDLNNERLKIDLKASVSIKDESLKVTLSFIEDWTSEVANINTKESSTLDEAKMAEIEQDFENSLTKTTLGSLFTTISGDYDSDIMDYYNGINSPEVPTEENTPSEENITDDTTTTPIENNNTDI